MRATSSITKMNKDRIALGSGTTAIACIKERRHFIGFEKDYSYWKKSVERVKNEQRQLTLW